MKTSIINKLAALLTASGILLTAPLTVTAASGDNKIVTSSTTEADKNYLSNGNSNAALRVSGSGVVYNGTNINATGTSSASGYEGTRAVVVNTQAAAAISGGTISTTGATTYIYTIYVYGTSSFTGDNLTLIHSATSTYDEIFHVQQSSTVRLDNSNLTTNSYRGDAIRVGGYSSFTGNWLVIEVTNGGNGVRADGVDAQMVLNDLQISVTGSSNSWEWGNGIIARSGANITGSNWQITPTSDGNLSAGLYVTGNGSEITADTVTITGTSYRGVHADQGGALTLNNATINLTNGSGVSAENNGTVNLSNSTVTVTGSTATGVMLRWHGKADVTLTNVIVNATGENATGIRMDASIGSRPADHHVIMDGGSVTSSGHAVSIGYHETATGISVGTSGTHELTIRNGAVITPGTGKAAIYVSNIVAGSDGTQTGADSTAIINIESDSMLNGDISHNGYANTTVNMTDSRMIGNLINSGSGILAMTLNNSTLTGLSTLSGTATTSLTLNNSAWNMTGKSKLTTLTSSGGSITIANVQGDDLTVSNGISGQTALHLTLSDGVKTQTEIRVVVDETNAMSNSAFVLGSEVSNGMYDYVLENNADGAWLVYTAPVNPPVNPPVDPTDPTDPITPPVIPPIISNEGDAVINTAAAVAGFWFTQLDNLHKRMGELRYNKPAGGDLINNVWVRAYGQQINASTGIYSVKGFSEIQYGVDLGTDHAWTLDKNNTVYTGIFAGYGGADRDFHTSYKGSTDSGYGGLYATWLNNSGWYADVVAKGQYFRNDFDGDDHAKYDSVGVGFSVEFGRQFEFKDGWFAEPSVQVSYLHLMNDNYTTTQGLSVDLADADVAQFYGGARFGRNLKLTNSGLLQPYIKAGGLGQISSGNTVRADGGKWRPNLDGARAVIGAGVVWQLNADSQLHLDYEASFGEKYDKPWGVNLGYRYQF